jgi:uncharacterized membrane protein YdfJ with MMPL/SSD domain
MKLNPETLARASSRHPWRTVGLWVLALAIFGTLNSMYFADALTNGIDFTNEPESKRAATLVEDRLRGPERFTELVIVTSETLTVEDAEFQSYVGTLQEEISALQPRTIRSVGSYLTEDGPVSDDQHSALLPVVLRSTDEDVVGDQATELETTVRGVDAPAAVEAHIAGPGTLFNEFQEIIEEDIAKGESIGIAVALVVLVIVLGAIVAGLIPIVLGFVAIGMALGLTALLGFVFDFSFFVQNMIFMIGLAVGIDYSLFVVARYREERRHGKEKLEAIGRTGATASRAVFFSGVTVILALLGLFIVPTTIFRALASGAIFVTLFAILGALTLLPAVLSLMGDRINRLRVRRHVVDREAGTGFWDRVTRAVMHRPVVSLVIGAGLLIALSIPYWSIHTGTAGISTLPDGIESKTAFELLERDFSGDLTSPAEVVIDGDVASPEVQAGVDDLTARLAEDDRFGPPAPVTPEGDLLEANEAGDLAVLSVPFQGDIYSDASVQALRDLREDYVPAAFDGVDAEVLVGGETAFNVDFFDLSDTYQPIVIAFVLGLSFLLLTVVFRSLVVPLKAIIMNLLSVGAAYGMVVMFFQQDVGPSFVKTIAEWFNFPQVETIEAWIPLFLFSVLFGLSMDYHVFLLTRIRERFDQTKNNSEAVAHGLRTTAGIITGAALIMVAVFGGFAAGRLAPLQQMGFGLAVAVFLDATVVRSVLVPSTMKLLGDRNWYLPKWLEWLPKLDVEGHVEGGAEGHELEEPVLVPDTPAELVDERDR